MLTTYWIGRSILPDSNRFGLMAALILGTMLLTQQQARMASYDMHLAAWGTLSVAAAMWAMRADQGNNRRSLGCWAFAALALAMAWMSKGPLALVIFAIPVGAWIALNRSGGVQRNVVTAL